MPALALLPHLHGSLPRRLRDSLPEYSHRLLVHRVPVHLLAQDTLDTLEQLDIVLRDERDGLSRSTRTGRSSDSMNVFLRMRGDVVIDDQVDQRDIQTSRRDVGGHQDLPASGFKLVQSSQPRTLT